MEDQMQPIKSPDSETVKGPLSVIQIGRILQIPDYQITLKALAAIAPLETIQDAILEGQLTGPVAFYDLGPFTPEALRARRAEHVAQGTLEALVKLQETLEELPARIAAAVKLAAAPPSKPGPVPPLVVPKA